jgi:hypothetical protein
VLRASTFKNWVTNRGIGVALDASIVCNVQTSNTFFEVIRKHFSSRVKIWEGDKSP